MMTTVTVDSKIKPFPFKILMLMYTKARYECRCDYFDGFRQLVKWLEPIEIPVIPISRLWLLPAYFENWDITELAGILKVSPTVIFHYLFENYIRHLIQLN